VDKTKDFKESYMKTRLTLLVIALVFILGACAQAASQNTNEATASFSEKDLVFVLDGTEYTLGTDALPLIEALGTDYDLDAATSCVYEGDDKTFIYDDICVYTNPIGGKDLFYLIEIFGGDYQTSKGIRVGSTLEEVKAAYGEGGFEEDSVYMYNLAGDKDDLESPQLVFELMDGRVTVISFYAPTNID